MARNESAEPESERTLIIKRVIDAPARILFEAYSKPEHVKHWFGPPGYPLHDVEMDFRVGGKFRFRMSTPEGGFGPWFGGEYLEIVPGRRIKYDNGFEGVPERMIVTVSYDEQKDGKTLLTIHTVFGTVEMFRSHTEMGFEQGTNAGIDQLVDLVRSMK